MSTDRIEAELGAANPVSRSTLADLDLTAGEAALERAVVAETAFPGDSPAFAAAPRRQPRSLMLLIAGGVAAGLAAAVFLLAGGASSSPAPAYGAELVRFAESTPLLLLEGQGWRVQNVVEYRGGEGSMEFVTGKPVPYEHIKFGSNGLSGVAPASVRQRKVELSWRGGRLSSQGPVRHPISLPVLDTTARVNTQAGEMYLIDRSGKHVFNRGRPGDRTMSAMWREDGHVLELRAAVPDLAAFRERLGWLSRVDSQTWLDAMPARVVKAADHDAAVRGMLKGIPVPASFKPSRVPDDGLTTDRDQVGAAVTGTVACLWFRQWGEARRAGDRRSAAEAEKAMATSKHWAILREMAKHGAYSTLVWQLAEAMPTGEWRRGWRLLPHAEALGCAREGIPVLPWKQKLQRERSTHAGI